MSFLIDTDTVSAHLRGIGLVTGRFLQYAGRLYLSVITVTEIKAWLYRPVTSRRFQAVYDALVPDVSILAVDADIADAAGRVSARLQVSGQKLATPDLLIAATAIVHDLTLVTH